MAAQTGRVRRWRQRERDAAVSEDAVLDAAVTVLSHDPGAPVEAVAARAGLSPRALRDRHPSRGALIEAAVLRGAHRIAAAAVLEDGSPAEQVGMLVARLWDDQAPVASFTTLWTRSPVAAQVDEVLSPVRALLTGAIARGAAEGTMRDSVAPTTLAWLAEHMLLACLAGLADGSITADAGRRLAVTQALGAVGFAASAADAVADAVDARLGPA